MSRLRTPICELLGIEYPIFQAGMGWVARADLAAAVSAAGGLGCIGAGSNTDADELRAEIRGVRERTDRPFAVDILFATVKSKEDAAVRYTDRVAAMIDVVMEEQVPVLAGGGLADGRGLVAAMALGAQGAWMGTRFIASREARAHDNYKQKILATDTSGTVVTRAHSGKPCRLIRNAFTESWIGHEDEIELYPLQGINVGYPASELGRIEGDVENGVLPAGQSCGMIHNAPPAGEILRAIADEAETVLARLSGVPIGSPAV